MADFNDENGRFEIGGVISRTFETIGANLVPFLGLSLILAGLPAFVQQWWQLSTFGLRPEPEQVFSQAYWMPVVVAGLVTMVSNAVLQAALTRATVLSLSGERPSFGRCLTVGLSMILPMIAIGFLLAIGVGLATLLLIVPGVILWLAWSVVVPVYVQEKVGIFEAFSRSGDLTRGSRWRIFLTMLVVVIGLWLLSIPAGLLTFAATATGSPFAPALVGALIGAIGGMVMVTAQASVYVELRDVKEGVAPNELESIFA